MTKKYREYVASLPCCVSGYQGDEGVPHHITGSNWLTGKCTSKKGSDLTCIPLRSSLHNELHENGCKSFEKKYNISQVEMVIKTILQAEWDGMLKTV